MSQPTRHDPYAALRILNFRWFISSLLAMTVATQIQAVVVAWQIYELTRDPLSLGLIGLAEAVPFIGFALVAGHVADRTKRLRISVMALVVLLLCSLTLLGFTVRPGIITEGRVWPIYLVIFFSGIARSFLQRRGRHLVPSSCRGSSIPTRDLAQLSLAARQGGGSCDRWSGIRLRECPGRLRVDAALMGLGVLSLVRLRRAPKRTAPSGESFLESLVTGVRLVDTVSVVVRSTLLQVMTPDHLPGASRFGQRHFHRQFQRAWRVRIRRGRAPDRVLTLNTPSDRALAGNSAAQPIA